MTVETKTFGPKTALIYPDRDQAISAIVAALELITAAGTKTDIRHELTLEIPFGEYVRRQPDFAEGVRAVLVDKRPDAQFQPKTFADVDPAPYRKILSYSAADDN